MKIAYFSQDYTPHDFRFMNALAATDHRVFYLRLEDANLDLENRAIPAGIETVDLWGSRGGLEVADEEQVIAEIRRILARIEPDVVHAGPVQGPAYLAAMAGFEPLITMSWGSDLLRGSYSEEGERRARFALRSSEIILTDSRAVTDRALELGANPDRLVTFPWGVNLAHFRPGGDSQRSRSQSWGEGPILLSTRSWDPPYGIEILVQGFIEAAHKNEDLRLLMLGGGGLENRIKTGLSKAGLIDRVRFPGRVANPDLVDYYHMADLYVSASRSDGSSISLLEAMACGLPVVASDIPGNAEWVENGENGWLFKDGNSSALAARLSEAANQRGQFARMGRRSRAIAEARADWETNFGVLQAAYQMAVGSRV